MARVTRYSSQEQVPVQQANLINAGNFRPDTSSAEILKAGADVVNTFAELAIRRQDAQDSLAATKASKARTQMELETQQAMLDEPDPDKWEELRAKISAKYGAVYAGLSFSDKTIKAKQDIEQEATDNELRMRVQLAATTQDIKNDIVESGGNLIDVYSNDDGSSGDADKIDKAIEIHEAALLRDTTPEIAELRMEAILKEAQEARAEVAIENIKPDLINAIALSNKPEDGYKALDIATAQLTKDGILTKPEAAEANKKLGDWIDNYVAGRIKAAKEADKQTTIQAYQSLSKLYLTGEGTYEDIDNSGLRETRRSGEQISDAERHRKYIKGSYKDAPTKNTPEGHTVSFAAVYDAAIFKLSPKEAYDVLLEARFVDGSITNEQFQWGVERIEKPYPKHVLEDLNATLKSNLEDFNRLFSSDADRNKNVNESLISWLDDLVKKEKIPSKKEMFAMSSAFRAGGGQPYDIGATIERGGQEWEIVGFDEDGEPLVELIE